MTRVLAVASGKGGTGKTSLSVNLSIALAKAGRRVCLLDADLGLSNVDVLLGISPPVTLEHVLLHGAPLAQAVTPVAPGLDVIPGGSGVARLADLHRTARTRLAREFATLGGYDYLVVDNSPGVSVQVIALCLACPELLVVINPDPSSITDAYALMKVLRENGMVRSPYLVLNRVRSAAEARALYERVRGAMQKYLKLDARYLGHVPQDAHVSAAAARQKPLLDIFPASPAGLALHALAGELESAGPPPGVGPTDLASVMEGAAVRMAQAVPASPAGQEREQLAATLADCLDIARTLSETLPAGAADAEGADSRAMLERMTGLLRLARQVVAPAPPRDVAPGGEQDAPRAVVISSDPAMGEILAESLEACGLASSPAPGSAPGAGPDAVVVYWLGDPAELSRELSGHADCGYVFIRHLPSQAAPACGRYPDQILDMPFRLDELTEAVRQAAKRARD